VLADGSAAPYEHETASIVSAAAVMAAVDASEPLHKADGWMVSHWLNFAAGEALQAYRLRASHNRDAFCA
jgi:hypothetical protein